MSSAAEPRHALAPGPPARSPHKDSTAGQNLGPMKRSTHGRTESYRGNPTTALSAGPSSHRGVQHHDHWSRGHCRPGAISSNPTSSTSWLGVKALSKTGIITGLPLRATYSRAHSKRHRDTMLSTASAPVPLWRVLPRHQGGSCFRSEVRHALVEAWSHHEYALPPWVLHVPDPHLTSQAST